MVVWKVNNQLRVIEKRNITLALQNPKSLSCQPNSTTLKIRSSHVGLLTALNLQPLTHDVKFTRSKKRSSTKFVISLEHKVPFISSQFSSFWSCPSYSEKVGKLTEMKDRSEKPGRAKDGRSGSIVLFYNRVLICGSWKLKSPYLRQRDHNAVHSRTLRRLRSSEWD